jgi:hypothetical protein
VKTAAAMKAAPAAHEAAAARAVNGPSLLNLASAMGLPGDRLSASLLSFFRFFSLPLDPSALARIRSQVLEASKTAPFASSGTASGDTGAAGLAKEGVFREEALFRFREALSLAAAASLSKGTELDGEALERYARAAAAFPGRRQSGGENSGREGAGGESSHSPPENSAGFSGGGAGGGGEGADQGTDASGEKGASALRKSAASDDPLLDMLNRLPGRDGKRWIVVPFTFGAGERYNVTLRVLVGPGFPGEEPDRVDRMALEIAANGGERWLFVADCSKRLRSDPGGAPKGKFGLEEARLGFGRRPSPGNRALSAMKKELSALLGLPRDQIYVQNGDFFSFFAPDSRDDVLLSVNKEV